METLKQIIKHTQLKTLKQLKFFQHNNCGNISLIGAISLIPLIGVISLIVDLGSVHSDRIENQTFADSIALSSALSYMGNDDITKVNETADQIAKVLGLRADEVSAELSVSPLDASISAIKISIETQSPLFLASAVGGPKNMGIQVTAFAQIPEDISPNCVIALNGNISITSSAQINATNCSVGANSNILLSTSGQINAASVNLTGSVSRNTSGVISTNPQSNNVNENIRENIIDPFAQEFSRNDPFRNIGQAERPKTNSVPAGQDLSITSSTAGTTINFQGNIIRKQGNDWVAPVGTYNFRELNVSGSGRLIFESPTTPFGTPSVITVSRNVMATTSSFINFGDSQLTVSGQFNANTSSRISLGDFSNRPANAPQREHFFGSIMTSTSGEIRIADANIDVTGDVNMSTSTSASIGAGDKVIGGDILVGSSAILTLGDGDLDVRGNITLGTSAILTTGTTQSVNINGSVSTSTSSRINFGSATYFIGGNFGGSTSATFIGDDVQFFIGGSVTLSTSANSRLSAPKNDGKAEQDTVVIATRSNGIVNIQTSARLPITGALYTPNANLILNTSGGLTGGGECTIIVARSISLSTSAQINTQCDSLSDEFAPPSSGGDIRVVG